MVPSLVRYDFCGMPLLCSTAGTYVVRILHSSILRKLHASLRNEETSNFVCDNVII